MGMYDDLQKDIGEALLGDLNDAYISVNYVTVEEVYNTDSMVNDIVETLNPIMSVKLKDEIGDIIDEPTKTDLSQFLVMDSDRGSFVFKNEMKVIDDTGIHIIEGIEVDPVRASWTLTCRRLG